MKETASDEARKVQWGVHSTEKVPRSEKKLSKRTELIDEQE